MQTTENLPAVRNATGVTTTLNAAAQARALRAIEDVHLAYYGKGGIRETADKLEKQTQSTAQVVYSLAVYASRQVETLEEAAKLFRELCAFAEAQYKEQHGVENLRDALPTWAVYKSTVLRGVTQFELDPVDYRSERQFRNAIESKAPKARAQEPDELKPPDEIGAFLERTPMRSSLRIIVSDLVYHAEAIERGKTTEAAAVLRQTSDRLRELVDPSKLN